MTNENWCYINFPQQSDYNCSCITMSKRLMKLVIFDSFHALEFVVSTKADALSAVGSIIFVWGLFRSPVVFGCDCVVSWRSIIWGRALALEEQARIPSEYVWSNFASPLLPQLLTQAPPGAQQLRFLVFLMVPHLEHVVLGLTVSGGATPARIEVWELVKHARTWLMLRIYVRPSQISIKHAVSLPVQAWTPSVHVWSNFESPSSPHLLNQAPPRAQQLRFLVFLTVPHWGHMELGFTGPTGLTVAGGATLPTIRADVGQTRKRVAGVLYFELHKCQSNMPWAYLRRSWRLRNTCDQTLLRHCHIF